MRILLYLLRPLGFLALVLLIVGIFLDSEQIRPFFGRTGDDHHDSIHLEHFDETNTGLVWRGYVVDVHLNCRTGLTTFEAYYQRLDYERLPAELVERHRAREICIAHGFQPQF